MGKTREKEVLKAKASLTSGSDLSGSLDSETTQGSLHGAGNGPQAGCVLAKHCALFS